jgi:phospholipid/cholesterol/gamma-HCH transport system permease protein
MTVAPHEKMCWIDREGGRSVLHLAGNWRLPSLAAIDADLARSIFAADAVLVDGARLAALDTAAALALMLRLHGARGARTKIATRGFLPPHERVLELVRKHLHAPLEELPRVRSGIFASIGWRASKVACLVAGHVRFFGMVCLGLTALVRRPSTLRIKELTAQLERVCLDAVPVVCLVTVLIGIVLAYLLGLQAEQYGAGIFVVDGVAIGATRELSPIIVAIIVAGRTGSGFTAQLGSMRLTQEIDAIRTLGLSTVAVLVLPRVLALTLALPLLVFVGDVMSMLGAMLVAGPTLDIAPAAFIARLRSSLDLSHVVIGLAKAPVFAIAIAVIACRMGMTVARDTQAVGAATTSTVVQSIVTVILLDAAIAVLLQHLKI